VRDRRHQAHPYVPNSSPGARASLLDKIGIKDVEELFADIPRDLRIMGNLELPEPFPGESELRRHVEETLSKNRTCRGNVNFLGGGCYSHYVPAVCDEITQRGEFLTAYTGDTYEDHGRWQVLFEYASMMGELLNMDVVSSPTYDWSQAAATSVRMASRITGRQEAIVAGPLQPERRRIIENYCRPDIKVSWIGYEHQTGQVDLDALRSAMSTSIAAVYFENPSYLGCVECNCGEITELAHDFGALSLVGVDPSSLGVVSPPADYGADIVCGTLQPLGIHMQFGGGLAGFVASHDQERLVMEYPMRLVGLAPTAIKGEYGFGEVAFDRTSFIKREDGKEFVGTSTALWAITAGVYLALMGPAGMRELGEGIMQRSMYAMHEISQIKGVRLPQHRGIHFKEFVLDFQQTGKTVKEINGGLLERGLFGGHDLTKEYPDLGEAALYCITESHSESDINRLVDALWEVIRN